MGGYGSGRRGTRLTTEDCHQVDANNFAKWLYFRPGVTSGIIKWPRGGSYSVRAIIDEKSASCVFHYADRTALVTLCWYTPGYGGRRYLFKCPKCGRRMRTLFFKGGEIACRICHDLTYKSCNKSHCYEGLFKYIAGGMRVPVEEAKQALVSMGLVGKKERMKRPRGRPRKC